jgi:hypothetical protein
LLPDEYKYSPFKKKSGACMVSLILKLTSSPLGEPPSSFALG